MNQNTTPVSCPLSLEDLEILAALPIATRALYWLHDCRGAIHMERLTACPKRHRPALRALDLLPPL